MTTDPTDPALQKAAAAYRAASELRKPPAASQLVRVIKESGQKSSQASARERDQASDQQPDQASSQAPDQAPPAPAANAGRTASLSLMITNAQKDSLRRLGVTEDEIRDMTPAEAHRRLGVSGRG